MVSDRRVEELPGKAGVLVEHGPLHLVVKAFSCGRLDNGLGSSSARHAFACLEQLAAEYRLLQYPHSQIHDVALGDIARTMLESVRRIGDEDLTPMAAVAGTIADSVVDWLIGHGAEKAIVDNGGDIAIRLSPANSGQSIRVGLRPSVTSSHISHRVLLRAGPSSWGVNTSGMGGRSFTRGVASAVTAFARLSTLADGAATAIANSCYIADPAIKQLPANSLDQGSDLGDTPVTVEVGIIEEAARKRIMEKGLQRATDLVLQGHIDGAILVVFDRFCLTPEFSERVGDLQDI